MATWSIINLERKSIDGGVTAVTFSVVEAEATDEHPPIEYSERIDITPNPAAEDFINYSDLDEATVISWVQQIAGKEEIESRLKLLLSIYSKPQPPASMIEMGVPW